MTNYPEIVLPLLLGFVLDLLFGDPHWLPHPIRLFGWLIAKGEKLLNNGNARKLKGAFLAIFLVSGTFLAFHFLLKTIPEKSLVYYAVASVFVFYGIANHSLIREALQVIRKLKNERIEAGRKQLSMIVGRETANLDEQQIRTAVLETLAENLSDGVIAPLFFYAVGGVPAMLAYKMANTLDSMIGYKNERFRKFGWFAARFDDVLNFLPARITAILMVLVTFSGRGFRFILKYGRKHSSPNAGYPEAALAGILNCRFGGPNIYHGKMIDKPFIGEKKRIIKESDIYKSVTLNMIVCTVFIVAIILINIL